MIDATLFVLVLGAIVLALAIDVAAVAGRGGGGCRCRPPGPLALRRAHGMIVSRRFVFPDGHAPSAFFY